MVIMTYGSLINDILAKAIRQKGINTAFEGDIYEINSMAKTKYPVFVVASTKPHQEHTNYMQFNLTLYYIDREQQSNNEMHNPDSCLIHSSGISILSNIIAGIRNLDDVLEVDDVINYTCWTDTEIFADKCNGVYCEISVKVPKNYVCEI